MVFSKEDIGRKRANCLFYGFNGLADEFFIDSESDQCPLISEDYTPCCMETEGREPKWDECPINTKEMRLRIIKIVDQSKIFPNELSPGKEKWGGVSFSIWRAYLDGKFS